MPLSKSGGKVMASMMSEYGKKKGEQVFYATMNKNKMRGKWEGPKPRGHSPLHTNPMPNGGEPNNGSFLR